MHTAGQLYYCITYVNNLHGTRLGWN